MHISAKQTANNLPGTAFGCDFVAEAAGKLAAMGTPSGAMSGAPRIEIDAKRLRKV
jgi:hypothetical protein